MESLFPEPEVASNRRLFAGLSAHVAELLGKVSFDNMTRENIPLIFLYSGSRHNR
jgi:heme oxygenase